MFPSIYNNKAAFYTKVYIFTNWAIHKQYKNVQRQYPSTWATYLRRIKTAYDFEKSKEILANKFASELRIKQIKLADLTLIKDNGDLPF